MSAKGRTPGIEKPPGEFFETPAWVTDLLVDHVLERPLIAYDGILDAGCGRGAIGSRLLTRGARARGVFGVEINPEHRAVASARGLVVDVAHEYDFTKVSWENRFDLVVMNPPFSLALEFISNAIAACKYGGEVAVLLRKNWLEGAPRKYPERFDFLREWYPDEYTLPVRPKFGKNKHGKLAADATAYVWAVWRPSHSRRDGDFGRCRLLPLPSTGE